MHSHTPTRSLALIFAVLATALGVTLLFAVSAERAEAKVPIYEFSTDLMAPPGATQSVQQAGGHADLKLDFTIGTASTEPKVPCLCNKIRDVTINVPSGVLGIPGNIPKCTQAEFSISRCPVESQVGIVGLDIAGPGRLTAAMAIFNMVPRNDQLALLAFGALAPTPIFTSFTARTESDYGLEAKTFGIPNLFPPYRVTYYLWGVPADPVHDSLRAPLDNFGTGFERQARGAFCNTSNPRPEIEQYEFPDFACSLSVGDPPQPSNSAPTPFLSMPTTCTGPLQADIETFAVDLEFDTDIAAFPGITGCDQLSFDPTLAANPTTSNTDSPSGLDVDLTVPQTLSPTTPSPSAIKAAEVELPEGFTINPNAADGKTSCTDEQANFGSREAAQCPEFAKIGSLGVTSASFPGVLPGAIYLGEPLPGNRYRLFLVVDGFSLHVKLPGVALPDPETGQLITRFENLPQFNFELFNLHFFGAERGLLATPEQCGTYAVNTTFTPWGAPDIPEQTSTQLFEIDSGPNGGPCPSDPRKFTPEVDAGVTDNTGGSHTEFAFDLRRDDGEQNLAGLEVRTPPGFSGVLAGIPYCPESTLAALGAEGASGSSQVANPACSASRIGTAVASAGAGSRPIHLEGQVYLAGPYKGAPLSLAVVTPAVSGPYDLGNVVVRAAIHVDPTTAEIRTVSDPLPQILEGIPLRLRRILVMLDRENFALNPTNCAPLSVDSKISGDEGGVSNLSNHFQVANCGSLDFAPKLGVRLRGSAKRNAHPALQAVLRAGEGEANIARSAVILPRTTLLDQGNLNSICTREQYTNDNCPRNSIYGRAAAGSPLLDEPLRGPVILRSNGGARQLPDLVAKLSGQVDFELVGYVDSVRGGLRTIFAGVPDVPVEKFVLRLQGGARKGLIANSVDLCRNPARFRSVMRGQNGRRAVTRPELRAPCGRKARKRNQRKRRRAGVSLARKVG